MPLFLRTLPPSGESYGGYIWNTNIGAVNEAPDWKETYTCGHGLHGLRAGDGDYDLLDLSDDSIFLVVESDTYVEIDNGKCKFPACVVRYAGDRYGAAAFLVEHGADPEKIRYACIAGDNAHVGHYGTATAGNRGTATAGYQGTATAGYQGHATAGEGGTATAGNRGTATAGNCGTATAGYQGHATAGDCGHATAGYSGHATAGYQGTATAGDSGTATAGDSGVIQIHWYDGYRCRIAVGYIGEDGLEAGVAYRCENGKFVRAE